MFLNLFAHKDSFSKSAPIIPYSGYNLQGVISANHQISYLEVIFAIIKFANHSMVLRGQINSRA